MIKKSTSILGAAPNYGVAIGYRKNYAIRIFRFEFWYHKPISLEQYRAFHKEK